MEQMIQINPLVRKSQQETQLLLTNRATHLAFGARVKETRMVEPLG